MHPITTGIAPDTYHVSCCGSTLRDVGDKCSCGVTEIRDDDGFPTMIATVKTTGNLSYSITALFGYSKECRPTA